MFSRPTRSRRHRRATLRGADVDARRRAHRPRVGALQATGREADGHKKDDEERAKASRRAGRSDPTEPDRHHLRSRRDGRPGRSRRRDRRARALERGRGLVSPSTTMRLRRSLLPRLKALSPGSRPRAVETTSAWRPSATPAIRPPSSGCAPSSSRGGSSARTADAWPAPRRLREGEARLSHSVEPTSRRERPRALRLGVQARSPLRLPVDRLRTSRPQGRRVRAARALPVRGRDR
jgi:hypothetical protein